MLNIRNFKLGYLVLGLIAAAVILIAAFNREVPLGLNDLPEEVLAQLKWKHQGAKNWKVIEYEVERLFTPQEGKPVISRLKFRLENLGNGIVRRTDNWYPKNLGGALLYEERYLLYANLIGLSARYREPAPGVHAILENEGWLSNNILSLKLNESEQQPADANWYLDTLMERTQDSVPGAENKKVTREAKCFSLKSAERDKSGRSMAKCEIKDSLGTTRTNQYIFVKELGIFILIDFIEKSQDIDFSEASNLKRLFVDGAEMPL